MPQTFYDMLGRQLQAGQRVVKSETIKPGLLEIREVLEVEGDRVILGPRPHGRKTRTPINHPHRVLILEGPFS